MPGGTDLDQIFAALADPTRRAILTELTWGDRTVGELAQPFEMSLAAISKHVRILAAAGLVRRALVAARERGRRNRRGTAAPGLGSDPGVFPPAQRQLSLRRHRSRPQRPPRRSVGAVTASRR